MISWVERLLSCSNFRGNDFNSILQLDEKLGRPHKSYRTIHVGGTNGKGSVSLKIAKALEVEGFTVGLYTSPHIFDIRERIQINGEMISEEDMLRLGECIPPSFGFFDTLTALAFLYFQEKKVDWAVIEVGLGGRFDATNVILPEISVITSIGYDHMHLLGNTLEEIAKEKGGIVKLGVPLVVGPTAAPFFLNAISTAPASFYDEENQAIARAVLEKLFISKTSIEEGLKKRPPCRFDVRGNVILDVAHNPDGFKKLIQALRLHFPKISQFHFIVAFSKDKDWKSCLGLIAPLASKITAVRVCKSRLENPETLQSYNPQIAIASSLQEALKTGEMNVVCGSFYLMDCLT